MSDLNLNQMSVFIAVVKEGGFTAASKILGLPKSRISRMVTELENTLGQRLLERTTRAVRTTEVGARYYQEYRPLFEQIENVHAELSDLKSKPAGTLRIAAPVGFATDLFGQWMTDFKAEYPEIDIELAFVEGEVHLINDGYDVGFAIGNLNDSSLIARKIEHTDPVLCASPEFLEKHGPIHHPDQLNDMPWIRFGFRGGYSQSIILVNRNTHESIELNPDASVLVNHPKIALNHLEAGQGVGINSVFFAFELLLKGKLLQFLEEWEVKQEPLYIVFPSGKHQPKKVRVFIDFIIEQVSTLSNLMRDTQSLDPKSVAQQLSDYMTIKVS